MTVEELRKALGRYPSWTPVVIEIDGELVELQSTSWTNGNTVGSIRFKGGGHDFVELHPADV
jgi:hypothetical protein